MIFIAIFGFIFLVGFSLFVAVLGQSFLRKHAKKIVREIGPKLTEREYRERYRRDYEEGIKEIEAKEKVAVEAELLERPGYVLPAAKEERGAGKWVLLSLGIVIVLFLSTYFGYRQWGELLKSQGYTFVRLWIM